MKKEIWTMKEIVEDYNNHQDYKLHSSDLFVSIKYVKNRVISHKEDILKHLEVIDFSSKHPKIKGIINHYFDRLAKQLTQSIDNTKERE